MPNFVKVPSISLSIDALVKNLSDDIENGKSIALGFEAPLFMSVPDQSDDLSRGRGNEGNRAMFAPAGGFVATLAIQQVAWVLEKISKYNNRLKYTLDANDWPPLPKSQTLLLWEAFVSGPAHRTHTQDAVTAATFFGDNETRLSTQTNEVTADNPLCMVHVAALWSGWASDIDRLHKNCLVCRPKMPYKPYRIIFDNNIYDCIKEHSLQEKIRNLVESQIVTVILPTTSNRERGEIPDKSIPAWFKTEEIGDTVFIADYSRVDIDCLGDGVIFTKHKGGSHKIADAVIADCANAYADIFVSEDKRARNRLENISKCKVMTFVQFKQWIE